MSVDRIKKMIKKILPILLPFVIIFEYLNDSIRYIKYSGMIFYNNNKQMLLGRIIAEYHTVEKGLVMPDVRLGFGKDLVTSLLKNVNKFIKKFGCNDEQLKVAISVIYEYYDFHKKNNFALNETLIKKIEHLKSLNINVDSSKQAHYSSDNYFSEVDSPFSDFAKSRKSVRNYSEKSIPIEDVREAINLSRSSPSSCNRQGVKCYLFTDKKMISDILDIQGGNRGWGHLSNKLIIVTSDIKASHGVYERNRVFIDGGMFAMNLLYSLHSKRIATCTLNCSFDIARDNKLRKLCGIDKSESFIVILSLGYPANDFNVANSKRLKLNDILIEK